MSAKTIPVELNEDEVKNLLFVFQGVTPDATLTSMPDLIPKLKEAQAKLSLLSLISRPEAREPMAVNLHPFLHEQLVDSILAGAPRYWR